MIMRTARAWQVWVVWECLSFLSTFADFGKVHSYNIFCFLWNLCFQIWSWEQWHSECFLRQSKTHKLVCLWIDITVQRIVREVIVSIWNLTVSNPFCFSSPRLCVSQNWFTVKPLTLTLTQWRPLKSASFRNRTPNRKSSRFSKSNCRKWKNQHFPPHRHLLDIWTSKRRSVCVPFVFIGCCLMIGLCLLIKQSHPSWRHKYFVCSLWNSMNVLSIWILPFLLVIGAQQQLLALRRWTIFGAVGSMYPVGRMWCSTTGPIGGTDIFGDDILSGFQKEEEEEEPEKEPKEKEIWFQVDVTEHDDEMDRAHWTSLHSVNQRSVPSPLQTGKQRIAVRQSDCRKTQSVESGGRHQDCGQKKVRSANAAERDSDFEEAVPSAHCQIGRPLWNSEIFGIALPLYFDRK